MDLSVRNILVVAAVAVVIFGISGCAMTGAPYPGGPATGGWVYTDVSQPSTNLAVATDATAKPTKMGAASASSILGIVGTGDASLQAAMKAGGITKVHHVDHHVMNILFVYATWTVKVYGE